jgi:hypothetical protein
MSFWKRLEHLIIRNGGSNSQARFSSHVLLVRNLSNLLDLCSLFLVLYVSATISLWLVMKTLIFWAFFCYEPNGSHSFYHFFSTFCRYYPNVHTLPIFWSCPCFLSCESYGRARWGLIQTYLYSWDCNCCEPLVSRLHPHHGIFWKLNVHVVICETVKQIF